MKKIGIALLTVLFLFTGCRGTAENYEAANEINSGLYPPQLYAQDTMYHNTGGTNALPEDAGCIGEILKTVEQTLRAPEENFSSNCLAVGTLLYAAESEPDKIYAAVPEEFSDSVPERQRYLYAVYEVVTEK